MKKLLIVADTYYPKVDGTLKFMEEFIKRTHQDFAISLLVPEFIGYKNAFDDQVVKTTFLKVSSKISLSDYPSMKMSLNNLKKIKQAITENDYIFIQGPALISFAAIRYANKMNKKIFFFPHVLSWELIEKFTPARINKIFHSLSKKVSIRYLNRCSAIFVPYSRLREQLEDAGVKKPMYVTQLGVDIEKFKPTKNINEAKQKLHIPPLRKVIGYVGRVSKEKNVGTLIKAFKRLNNQDNLHLLIVGDGQESQKKIINSTRNKTITGFVNNVEDYLQAMDIFVMPSLTETTSLATLEAMSCGLSVIASRVGFIKEYVKKGENGLFFPRNSVTMLTLKLEKLLKDDELRKRLGEQARKTIVNSFSWDKSINRIKHLINEQMNEQVS